ncbi:MAG: hypothetical protein JWR19_1987 [Pedosphaera sp.]|nr:hypothetical protein [Pedosphaera sp.]
MISGKDIDTLRSIARAGGDYDAIKRLLAETQWEIDADEVDLGFLRIFVPDVIDERYRLIIGYHDPDHPPYSLLTFSLFPDSEERIAAFNSAFHSVGDAITRHLGAPIAKGERQLSFRTWSYAYQRWSLPEGEFTLVQGEFDIQDGMDITLWIQPVGTPIEETVHL